MNILSKIKKIIKSIFNKSPVGIIIYSRKFIKGEPKIDYQERFINFNISQTDRILDIGSGGDPFKYANFLIDRYPGKTHHRDSSLKTNNLPFSVSDIEYLPFKDKIFDFVYCAHVLEHVENPEKALNEIKRIGKKGYIEVPTRISDIVFNFVKNKGFHKWYVNMVGNALVFIEYSDWERQDTMHQEIFYMAHSYLPNSVSRMYKNNKNLFTNMFLWEKDFSFFIFNKAGNLISKYLIQ